MNVHCLLRREESLHIGSFFNFLRLQQPIRKENLTQSTSGMQRFGIVFDSKVLQLKDIDSAISSQLCKLRGPSCFRPKKENKLREERKSKLVEQCPADTKKAATTGFIRNIKHKKHKHNQFFRNKNGSEEKTGKASDYE